MTEITASIYKEPDILLPVLKKKKKKERETMLWLQTS